MLYQKLLMGNKPYFLSVGSVSAFETHRHPEIELSCCLQGHYDIICEKKQYTLNMGDFAVVSPMAAHEIPQNNTFCRHITIELGYILLGEHFDFFTNQNSSCRIYKKSELEQTESYKQLMLLLEETAALHCSDLNFCELSIKGNLYKISALLLQLCNCYADNSRSKRLTDVKKIDKALESIYARYYEPLTVESVGAFCGYSKSNFCKIFKNITGDTFHNTLNRHRIEVACMLLRETDHTIEKIAQETGFADTKSFCRVFKKIIGNNAGEYRKSFK